MQRLQKLLKNLYPQNHEELINKIHDILPNQPINSHNHDDWYKNSVMYVAYPDSFIDSQLDANFYSLSQQIPRISQLGCNTIHILPFLESPMIDAGFDVSDYLKVRLELGGNKGFSHFLQHCKSHNISPFMDLVINHTSNQHQWFQSATGGDPYYRDYYIHTVVKPELIEKFTDQYGIWAKYHIDGHESTMRILFPEQAGSLPHFTQASDGYWYYHTFYPHQIDLNWHNPNVFLEFSKIMLFWLQKDMNFRLDAVPFVGKNIYDGDIENNKHCHLILETLNSLKDIIRPRSIFLVEAYQPVPTTISFYGISNQKQSELAYAFQLVHGLWIAIIDGNSEHIWSMLDQIKDIPQWSQWVTFIRNHDQLSFEYCDPEQQLVLSETLSQKGLSFMDGFGVSGRTATFLDNNLSKIISIHSLLFSLPGLPAIYYGDELGLENNYEFMESQTRAKQLTNKETSVSHDTRDCNRGPVHPKDQNTRKSKIIQQVIQKLSEARKQYPEMSSALPEKIDSLPPKIFGVSYWLDSEKLKIYVNNDSKPLTLTNISSSDEVLLLNNAKLNNHTLFLPRNGVAWLTTPL